jgi:Ferric reductase like transmembrane component
MPGERVTGLLRSFGRVTATVLVLAVAGASTAWLLGRAAQVVAGDRRAPWIVGRASGITAYLLLLLVVVLGLVLAHPWRTRFRRPSTVSRIRAHAVLAVFTLAFTVLHVVVLATDRYAGVGWRGALLPLGASYRPAAVTLGVVGLYAGMLAGITASLAGRLPARLWWPLHKVSAAALLLVWVHGLLAGSDTPALLGLYAGSGGLVLLLAVSRYVAASSGDRLEELAAASGPTRTPLRAVQ